MTFRFKQFTVEDDKSTLRVGTDAMVLGAWAVPGAAKKILDIGTGCGVLALMMAQKSESRIDAIDVDHASVNQANENFRRSLWSDRLRACVSPLEEYALNGADSYDFIITNPPFFQNQLKSSNSKVNIAKHDTGLSLGSLVISLNQLLSPDGRVCLIYPYADQQFLAEMIRRYGFNIAKTMVLKSRPGLPPGRILAEYSRSECPDPGQTEICILGDDGKFSREYLKLTEDFHDF